MKRNFGIMGKNITPSKTTGVSGVFDTLDHFMYTSHDLWLGKPTASVSIPGVGSDLSANGGPYLVTEGTKVTITITLPEYMRSANSKTYYWTVLHTSNSQDSYFTTYNGAIVVPANSVVGTSDNSNSPVVKYMGYPTRATSYWSVKITSNYPASTGSRAVPDFTFYTPAAVATAAWNPSTISVGQKSTLTVNTNGGLNGPNWNANLYYSGSIVSGDLYGYNITQFYNYFGQTAANGILTLTAAGVEKARTYVGQANIVTTNGVSTLTANGWAYVSGLGSMYVGYRVAGDGVPYDTYVLSYNSSTGEYVVTTLPNNASLYNITVSGYTPDRWGEFGTGGYNYPNYPWQQRVSSFVSVPNNTTYQFEILTYNGTNFTTSGMGIPYGRITGYGFGKPTLTVSGSTGTAQREYWITGSAGTFTVSIWGPNGEIAAPTLTITS